MWKFPRKPFVSILKSFSGLESIINLPQLIHFAYPKQDLTTSYTFLPYIFGVSHTQRRHKHRTLTWQRNRDAHPPQKQALLKVKNGSLRWKYKSFLLLSTRYMRLFVCYTRSGHVRIIVFLNNMGDNDIQKTSKHTHKDSSIVYWCLPPKTKKEENIQQKVKSYITIFYFPTNLSTEPFFLVFSFPSYFTRC